MKSHHFKCSDCKNSIKKTLTVFLTLFLILNCINLQSQNLDSLLNAFSENYQKGDFRSASINLEKALPQLAGLYGFNDTAHYVIFVQATARCYELLYEYEEAIPYRLQALHIYENVAGKENRFYATSCNDLASLYKKMGKYEMAEPLYIEANEITKRIFGVEHEEYATSINNLSSLYVTMDEYEKALPLLITAKKINEINLDKGHPNYIASCNNLSSVYKKMDQFDKSEALYIEAKQISEKNRGKATSEYADCCDNLGSLYFDMGQYQKAESLIDESKNIREKVLGVNNLDYTMSCNNLASLYMRTGQYKKAENLFLESKQIREKILGKDNLNYATSCENLGSLYLIMGLYTEAKKIIIEGKQITNKLLGTVNSRYASSCAKLAEYYRDIGKFDQAEQLYIEAKSISGKIKGKNSVTYATACNNLGGLYFETDQFEKAEINYKEAISIYEKCFGKEHPSLASGYNNLGLLFANIYQFKNAESYYLKAKEIFERRLDIDNLDYANICDNLAGLYCDLQDFNNAEYFHVVAKQIRERLFGNKSIEYSVSCNNLGLFYGTIGQLNKAIPLFEEAMKIYQDNFLEENPRYATCCINLAIFYLDLKLYDEAELLLLKGKNIREKVFGKMSLDYAQSCDKLGLLYRAKGDTESAKIMLIEGKDIRENIFGKENFEYAISCNNLAWLYSDLKNYYAAEQLNFEALKITLKVKGPAHWETGQCYNNLGALYIAMGKYDKGKLMISKAKEIYEDALGKENAGYAICCGNLAIIAETSGDYLTAQNAYVESLNASKSQIENQFSFLAESEREKYIETFKIYTKSFQSFTMRHFTKDPSIIIDHYNSVLYDKGMILNSCLQVNNSIQNSKDTSLQNFYKYWIANRLLVSKLLSKPITERYLNVDSLATKTRKIERELTQRSQEFKMSQKLDNIRCENVYDSLNRNEVSIEFVSFEYYNGKNWTDSTYYCALILRKDYEYPKMVYLFEERQINALLPSASASEEGILKTYSVNHEESKAKDLYKLIWAPLEPYLKGVTKIDFAVSGQLNRIAFHALSDTSGNLLLNKYDLVQLNSTREVALPKDDKGLESIAIFGGIDYSIDTTDMLALAREVNTDNLSRSLYRSDTTSRNLSLNYLPGTMEEASEVGKECQEKGIDVKLFSGKLATEEQFRLLGEKKSPSVIHIATHGFYFPEEKQKDRDDRMRFMQIGQQENQFVYSPDPLIRSGLAMAGANHAWRGEKIPEGVEDGILTARDVSQLNLLNTELVVLSACQTGLGDVKGSEGVYGLQRGFKMAGARYLMMSLWKVPDETTKEFMTNFYGHLSSGMAIRESYRNTQKDMSAKYPDDPFRWAAFLLVE